MQRRHPGRPRSLFRICSLCRLCRLRGLLRLPTLALHPQPFFSLCLQALLLRHLLLALSLLLPLVCLASRKLPTRCVADMQNELTMHRIVAPFLQAIYPPPQMPQLFPHDPRFPQHLRLKHVRPARHDPPQRPLLRPRCARSRRLGRRYVQRKTVVVVELAPPTVDVERQQHANRSVLAVEPLGRRQRHDSLGIADEAIGAPLQLALWLGRVRRARCHVVSMYVSTYPVLPREKSIYGECLLNPLKEDASSPHTYSRARQKR
mmetsp:Transcript_10712/g.29776  ORF Transcript_10712/g.29776 Transcript_10712/m.29776 type:complete len:262 (-) Transcript_10712:2235-3020(-)